MEELKILFLVTFENETYEGEADRDLFVIAPDMNTAIVKGAHHVRQEAEREYNDTPFDERDHDVNGPAQYKITKVEEMGEIDVL